MSRTKKKRDPEFILAELLEHPLIERVAALKALKESIDKEVKEKQEAAKEAEQIANGK